jgi:acetolactate synthase-1/2/3 large subunit
VCLVSRGPGITHAMVALHTAFHDAVPLVMLIGHVERKDIGRMALQEQNYPRLLSDITKSVIEVMDAGEASEAISRAFHVARSGTPGPVAVVLPEDLLTEAVATPLIRPRIAVAAGPRDADMARLESMLKTARRPLLWVGGAYAGATQPDALAELERLADTWGLPVCPTNKRPHLFDAGHPNYAGHVGIRTPPRLLDQLKTTDLLIALGERLTDTLSQSYTFPSAPDPQMPLVHVWPDAAEIGRVWRPALGLPCDPQEVVRALLALPAPEVSPQRREWIANLNAAAREVSLPIWDRVDDGVHFGAVVAGVNRHLARDAALTLDAGSFSTFVFRYLRFRRGQTVLTSVVGAMGAGVPMAVAAALRDPRRQVVAFVGDGGALMTGNELATARLHGVNPIIIIADNGYYGTIGLHQDMRFPGRPFEAATQLANPDFALWARAFGARGITIAREDEIEGALAEAFAPTDRPVVVHARTSAFQMSAWRQASRALAFPRPRT